MKTVKTLLAIAILSIGFAASTQAAPPVGKFVRIHRLHQLHHHRIHHAHHCKHHVVIVK